VRLHMHAYEEAWEAYTAMRESGVASEVARNVLPVGIFSSAYVTCNARSLMAFLSLRTHEPDATFVSYPLAEIEWLAEQMEFEALEHFPVTLRAFDDNGRVAP
jgi:thymidylate synthase (FAD)